MSKTIKHVTAAHVLSVSSGLLNQTDAAAVLRLLVKQGFAVEAGNRKNMKADGDSFVIVRGRPSVTFDVSYEALASAIGQDRADQVADLAAQDAAAYAERIAIAEKRMADAKAEQAKQAKVRGLEAKLTALRTAVGQ